MVAAPAQGAAQSPEFAVARWGTEQGLPSNAVLDIAQSRDGYLWLSSYNGLVRFDGVSFRTYSDADIPGLSRASFWQLAADPAGTLWAGAESDGLVRLQDGRWTVFRTRDGLKSDKTTAVAAGPDGVAWVGTRAGLSQVVGGRARPLPGPAGMPEPVVAAIAPDPHGGLWIGTAADGLLHYRDGAYTRFGAAAGLADPRIASLYADRDGSVWVGTYGPGITRIQGGVVTRFAADSLQGPRRVNDFLRDAAGTLWIGADNGLFRLQGNAAVLAALPDGERLTQVSALHEDADGNIWVGMRQGGLARLRRALVSTVGTAQGLPHPLVSAVAGDGADGAWIATQGGVAHWTPRGVQSFVHARGALRDDIARDVLRARNGDVWVATNGGLTRIRRGSAVTFTTRDGLPDDRVRTLLEGADGTLWIGTFNGLAALQGGRIRAYGRTEGLTDGYILALYQDRRGTLWISTQSEGLIRMRDGRFAPGPRALGEQPVFRMAEDPWGALWVGTARGMARIDGERVATLGTRQGLPGNAVFQLLDDGHGRAWITGPWGVGHVDWGELRAVADGRSPALHVKQYGSRDGMVSREASSVSRAWQAPDGTLWFPTPAGAARIDPTRLHRNLRPPVPVLERVVIDDVAHEGDAAVEVAPGARKLEFHFTATGSYAAPEQIGFRWRLEGYDHGWVEGGTRRAAYYTNLRPGRYVFRLEARNEEGVPSTRTAAVAVRLRPHLWQTAWFLAAAAAAVLGLALAAHRARVGMIRRTVREEMLRDLSLRDELTGLYNRRGLLTLGEQRVREAARDGRGFDVVFIDMDELKRINDTLGHPEGDRAIRDAAEVIRASFRDSDIAARLGGDEFAVLVQRHLDPHGFDGGVAAACDRLLDEVARHNAAAGRPYPLSLSLGVSAYEPAAPRALEALLESADQEMYAQKRRKRMARV
jgi:diguanylate cyclase (GGDEF)-like protein